MKFTKSMIMRTTLPLLHILPLRITNKEVARRLRYKIIAKVADLHGCLLYGTI